VSELTDLVDSWLPLPDVAERLGTDVGKVRRMIQEQILIAVRVGERNILSVPEQLILDGEPLPHLQGTLTLLKDVGFREDEALRWLFTPDDTLPGSPIDALRANRKTEVRRRAQALAF
jgi:hypothetical protein